MARPCTVCQKQERALIDLKLCRGETATSIAKDFPPLKIDAILRHKVAHLKKQPGEEDTSITLLKLVIAELDELAATAMAKGDVRAAIDARKRKTDAIEVLLQQEQKEEADPVKGGSMGMDEAWKKIPYWVIDSILDGMTENYDRCPECGALSVPKATGNSTGKLG